MKKDEIKNFLKTRKNVEIKAQKNEETTTMKNENKTGEVTKKVKNSKLIDCTIKIPLYLVVILLPIFFYANVSSPFELNKQILLVGLVGISALAWIGKMAWKNEIKFKKSFLLIPVLTFLLIYGISTVYSSYYEQSMWGYFGGESNAFVTVLFLITFFVLIFNNINNYSGIAKLIFSFLFSGFILTIFSILQFSGVYLLPFEFAKVSSFTTIGSVYVFSIYIALIFLVSVTLFLSSASKWIKAFLMLLSFGSFFLLAVINFKMIWIFLIFMLAVILGITILIENKKPSQSRVLPMIFIIFTLLFFLRGKPLINNVNLPVEVFLKHKVAAEISLSSIKDNPMLGSGPTTFANVYKKNRPSDLGEFSAVNFNESTSYFSTLASTTGILGVASFLFLVIAGLFVVFKEVMRIIKSVDDRQKNNFNNYSIIALAVGWLFLTIFLFAYFSNITIMMLWWLFLALLLVSYFLNRKSENSALNEITTTSNSPKTSFILSFGFVLVIIGFTAVMYLHGQKYVAAVYFGQALAASNKEDNIEKTAEKISKAVSLDPNRDLYYRDLAVVHLALAKDKIEEKGLENLTPDESNFISTRFRSALQSLDKAKTLNPADSLNFISIANLYREFIVIQKDSGIKAIENYEKAIELDPKNPEIYQYLANVQITLADLEMIEQNSGKQAEAEMELPQKSLEYLSMAEDYLKKVLILKPEHVGANITLVSLYERQRETEKALNKAIENVELYPQAAELQMDLGRLYYQREDYDQAEDSLLRALGLNVEYANARYLYGLVLDKKGNKNQAIKEFEKIKESNQDNELLQKIIDNLKNNREALANLNESASATLPVVEENATDQEGPVLEEPAGVDSPAENPENIAN